MISWLPTAPVFPEVSRALPHPNGLLAAGGDLSPARLLAAYHRGIFPWYSPGDPILWWSPDPRMVLIPQELKISRSLAKTLRNADYRIRFDHAFTAVVAACAETPRAGQRGTWISAEMRAAYTELHRLGHAHSIETWIDDQLVGGLYGVALGRVFFGESMFSHRSDASKIALAHLCAYLVRHGYALIDCQMETPHLATLGAAPLPRDEFLARLKTLSSPATPVGAWSEHEVARHYRTTA
ncbi:MAG TPA: leucyl/phenylalanyl-tRNA--protein transferase [Rhodocyclaceae bacterium]|nr:leucyl/phenylalanyl-tRNA--protein transferase [Rhodocyclaceae bacterium]